MKKKPKERWKVVEEKTRNGHLTFTYKHTHVHTPTLTYTHTTHVQTQNN